MSRSISAADLCRLWLVFEFLSNTEMISRSTLECWKVPDHGTLDAGKESKDLQWRATNGNVHSVRLYRHHIIIAIIDLYIIVVPGFSTPKTMVPKRYDS